MDRITKKHNKYAPYWAAMLSLFVTTGLATINLNFGSFWKGYVLDMIGPAWTYTLFRGLFTVYKTNKWTRIFTPIRTFMLMSTASIAIEMAQYFNLYEATFDGWDIAAYLSLLVPVFALDLVQSRK